jgi:hypothetical protein
MAVNERKRSRENVRVCAILKTLMILMCVFSIAFLGIQALDLEKYQKSVSFHPGNAITKKTPLLAYI